MMHPQSRWLLEVYYDGWCPLCTGIRKRLERWDWMHVLQFYSIREPEVTERISVSVDHLISSMHVRETGSGRIRSGIEAVHALCMRVPMLMLISPFVWISMKLGVGGKLYTYIASRRTIVPAGQCNHDSCDIPLNGELPVKHK
ncbi:thiol-disulfide oxidoreductase DCC family protein [Paenibacillus sp. B1-33]|uniref:thiol-disulfide oxidoreductase DCC family protein n=1 Tax=unclassified Paenibacillus TaxID=185978 RepID=UPI003D283565